jgi:glycosyltransferase involved in cell wall biosynthesis
MSTQPTLALLIPAFNASQVLPRLLMSAKSQTIQFDEILVYDDCSSDSTQEVAESYGARVIRGNQNKGCSVGKNILAREASTTWIHFHDADDELMPNFVELAQKWMKDGKHDVVLFDYEYRDNSTNQLIAVRSFDRVQLEADPIRYAIDEQINPFCGLYRRSAFLNAGGYDEDPNVLYNEDVAFHLKMAFARLTFSADNTVAIINYKMGASMSSSNAKKCAIAHFEVIKKYSKFDLQFHYKPEFARRFWLVGGSLFAHGLWDMGAEAALLARGLSKPPVGVGSEWFRLMASVAPIRAFQLREVLIRTFRPSHRSGI